MLVLSNDFGNATDGSFLESEIATEQPRAKLTRLLLSVCPRIFERLDVDAPLFASSLFKDLCNVMRLKTVVHHLEQRLNGVDRWQRSRYSNPSLHQLR